MLGFGTVGTGVARLLINESALLSRRVGARIKLAKIADVRPGPRPGVDLRPGVFTTDAESVISDKSIQIIIELIGGKTIARKFVKEALENGKHVVTANKALLATNAEELFKLATEKKVKLAFEASVGGAIPILRSLREAFVATRFSSIFAIINGTSNFILSEMARKGTDYKDALEEAQRLGYAEADPTFDVDGTDAAHKLAILIMMAYGTPVTFSKIYKQGITGISPHDIAFAKEFGYRIKLLAIAKFEKDMVEARVHPTLIPEDHVLAGIDGVLNAVHLKGTPNQEAMLVGHGAGMMPTAGAVIGDVVEIAREIISGSNFNRVPARAWPEESFKKLPIRDIGNHRGQYYLRCKVLDKPGVLAGIAGILGEHGISIAQVIQKDRKLDGAVPIIILTHEAHEKDLLAALNKIDKLPVAKAKTNFIRIEE